MTLAAVAASVVFLTASPVTFAQEGGNRTAGETLDDTTINTSVKANLTDNDEVHARNINLETHRGRVALIGYVRSKEQHKSAIATAENCTVQVTGAEARNAGRGHAGVPGRPAGLADSGREPGGARSADPPADRPVGD